MFAFDNTFDFVAGSHTEVGKNKLTKNVLLGFEKRSLPEEMLRAKLSMREAIFVDWVALFDF